MASNPLTPAEQALVSQAWERADSITAHLDGLMAATPRDEEEAPYDKYIPINQKRVKRIRKALAKQGLRDELAAVATSLPRGARMLVLNEFWCGDGAQILPVHEAIALASEGTVDVRVLMRDDNLEVMDLFLTNGGRSIPKTAAAASQSAARAPRFEERWPALARARVERRRRVARRSLGSEGRGRCCSCSKDCCGR